MTFSLVLFTATTFFRDQLDNLLGNSVNNVLFFISIVGAVIGFLLIAWLRKKRDQHEHFFIAFAIWFLYWIALSRDAARYEYFVGIPIAFFTAVLLKFVSELICLKLNIKGVLQLFIKTGITVTLLTVLMFWTPAGAHAKHSIFTVKHALPALPGNTSVENAFRWMKANIGDRACVAANWGYGSQLNVLGGVKTIIDQDHYIQHWIHLFYKHVYAAQSDYEAIEFLKSHKATHLMFTIDDMLQLSDIHSLVFSKPKDNQIYSISPLRVRTYQNGRPFLVPIFPNTPFTHIDIDQIPGENSPIITTAKLKDTTVIEISNIFIRDKIHIKSQKQTEENSGGILVYFNSKRQLLDSYYIPPISWNSLAVRLFFRGESSDTFVPVFPEDGDATSEVKVWEINYPPDVKSNPKYLETKPPEQQGETQ